MNVDKETRVDVEEIAQALKKLDENARIKFFYMIEGAQMVQPPQPAAS
ncbi:hypothetical protein [Butyricicoccus sp. Marseille-Q5471]|nr:hypothetical protein [Butyricicoccus sp. Marseille-Q5471]